MTFEDRNKASNNKKTEDKNIVPFVMKCYPWLHKLKQKFKESKNCHLIQNIQKTAPDIIQKRRFLKIYPCQLENGYNAREEIA